MPFCFSDSECGSGLPSGFEPSLPSPWNRDTYRLCRFRINLVRASIHVKRGVFEGNGFSRFSVYFRPLSFFLLALLQIDAIRR